MNLERPNPDELLARVEADAARQRRGKLRIFFGYAAGVGKTFAMLTAARRERAAGVDVVVGYVEPHGRAETEALLEGLEAIPSRTVAYRGVALCEFDLDAALARRPQLILVDELAHTNAEGSRHVKRWHDVEELLAAGIDVYTTLNVQHVESLNDVIAQITGVVVRETLSDAVIERADEIELIDITPEELIERLQQGKVYIAPQAERALRHFFQKPNLLALREMSLRQTANRLRRDVDAAHRDSAAQGPWATSERLLVCVGPSPTTARLIRTAKRMAAAFGAQWLAVAVSTGGEERTPTLVRELIAQHLALAEQLGADTHMLVGSNVAETVLEFARSHNVTKIVVGKTAQPRWKRWLGRTVVDDLLETSGEIDVYVIQGAAESPPPVRVRAGERALRWSPYLGMAVVVAACGLLGWLSQALDLAEANIVMVFLLGTALVATRFGRGPAIVAAIANVLVFDFCFVRPYFSFAVSDTQYVLTFGVMLTIGLLISALTARAREQLRASQQQERRTAALFRLTRQMSEMIGTDILVRTAGRQIAELFAGEVVVYLRDADGPCQLRFGEQTSVAHNPTNAVVAQWVMEQGQIAGAGTDTLPNATALFVPLVGSERTVGALGVRPNDSGRFSDPEQRRLLETCASLVALSIERNQSVLEAHEAQLQVESERLRNSLLSSVSHDLRTPLAAIAGAASGALESADEPTRRELLQTIVDEAQRLARLVDNLLDMTRLEAGAVRPNRQWHVLEEVVGTALARARRALRNHAVHVDIPADLPLLALDGELMEQTFVNLLENAARHTPEGSRIDIVAQRLRERIEIKVSDNGPGLVPGMEAKVFDKFFRGVNATTDGRRGVGLGLAICQAIVQAHQGRIWARNRPTGGAEFVISLPVGTSAPQVPLDSVPAQSPA